MTRSEIVKLQDGYKRQVAQFEAEMNAAYKTMDLDKWRKARAKMMDAGAKVFRIDTILAEIEIALSKKGDGQ